MDQEECINVIIVQSRSKNSELIFFIAICCINWDIYVGFSWLDYKLYIVLYVNQCCGSGSGIWGFFTPWTWDLGWIFSRSRIQRLFFCEIFLRTLVLLFFFANKTCSWNHKKQEKRWFYFSSLFLCTVRSDSNIFL
jgi:hypothetical protein